MPDMIKRERKRNYLTFKQLQAAELMGRITEEWNVEKVAQEIGVSKVTIYAWMKNPTFLQEVNRSTTEGRLYIRPKVWRGINRHLDEALPNPKIIEIVEKIIGEFVPAELRANINLTAGIQNQMVSKSGREILLRTLLALEAGGITNGSIYEELLREAKETVGETAIPMKQVEQIEQVEEIGEEGE